MTLHYFQLDRLDPEQDKRLRKVFQERSSAPEKGGGGRSAGGGGGVSRGGSCRDTGTGVCDRFTPATVEQLASEHETVDGFISALEARVVLLR